MANEWRYVNSEHRVVVNQEGNKSYVKYSDPENPGDLIWPEEIDDYLKGGGVIDNENPPSPDSQFTTAATDGVSVTMNGKPELNAVYDFYGTNWDLMVGEFQYVSNFKTFSGGQNDLVWQAKDKQVTFARTNDFSKIVRVLADYQTQWNRYTQGLDPNPPVNTISLTADPDTPSA